MNQKLLITGLGAVTPIGTGVEAYWRNLLAGQSGVGLITRFDSSKLPVHIAAEVRDFNPAASLPRSMSKNASRFLKLACAAGIEALDDSGFDVQASPSRIGVSMGTAMAGADEIAASGKDFCESRTGRISPHLVPMAIPNMAAAQMSISCGISGPGLTLGTACSAGADAVMAAALLILAGEADAMLVMGGESILTPAIVSSLAQARALSRRNDAPEAASRPFDRERDGFVIGEGGGAILLESEQSARKRHARIYGVLSGWGNTLDSYHITAPNPHGENAALCMRRALDKAGLAPEDIGYVNAHGTSTRLGDRAEAFAYRRVFGEGGPAISSTKGATGHLMGAGGLTELIACLLAIRDGVLPPTLNLESQDEDCQIDLVGQTPREKKIRHAMSNSLGFGGQNSSLVVSAYS